MHGFAGAQAARRTSGSGHEKAVDAGLGLLMTTILDSIGGALISAESTTPCRIMLKWRKSRKRAGDGGTGRYVEKSVCTDPWEGVASVQFGREKQM